MKTVLITRPEGSTEELTMILEEAGFRTVHIPMIEIKPPESWQELDDALHNIEQFDGIIFSSANSARMFFTRLHETKNTTCQLPSCYAVGEKTANAIVEGGGTCFIIPEKYSGADLAASIEAITGKTFLLPQSDIGRDEIQTLLSEAGGKAVRITTYRTTLPDKTDVNLLQQLLTTHEIDCIAFFSPSAVGNFLAIAPDFVQESILLAAIGETTANAISALKLRVDIVPSEATSESLAEMITERFTHSGKILDPLVVK